LNRILEVFASMVDFYGYIKSHEGSAVSLSFCDFESVLSFHEDETHATYCTLFVSHDRNHKIIEG
jgi:hypothetical protein